MALASLRPLRSRNFALVWSAALVSNVGTWMQGVALGILVYAHTHQAGWTGLVAAAAFIPLGLLSPVGGVMADRHDRRRWLIGTTLAETACAAALAVLVATGHVQPGLVVLVAFAGGAAGAIGFPSYQAMLPDLVPKADLVGAISLSSAQFNLGRVIGPAAAGLALLHHDYTLTFAINAASFLAVVLALCLVRLPVQVRLGGDAGVVARLVDGARTARADPGCRAAIGLIAVVGVLVSPFIALVPVMSAALGHGSGGTATLVTAQGVGAVVGVMALPSLAERFEIGRMVRRALFVLPLLIVAYGLSPTLWVATIAFLLVGAGYISVLAGLNSVVQLRAPTVSRGRVLGLFMMALGICYPLGAVVQGSIAGAIGIRTVTVGGAVLLLGVLVLVAAVRPTVLAALGDPSAPATGAGAGAGADAAAAADATVTPTAELP